MAEENDHIKREHFRQQDALYKLNDEIMSMLHAQQMRQNMVSSEAVRGWLRQLSNLVQQGLGKSQQSPQG